MFSFIHIKESEIENNRDFLFGDDSFFTLTCKIDKRLVQSYISAIVDTDDIVQTLSVLARRIIAQKMNNFPFSFENIRIIIEDDIPNFDKIIEWIDKNSSFFNKVIVISIKKLI